MERRFYSFDCARLPKRFIPRKGTETRVGLVGAIPPNETIYTPQGDGNLQVALGKPRLQETILYPARGRKRGAQVTSYRLSKETIYTPQGDGNPMAAPIVMLILLKRFMPRKGTETH